MKRENIKLLEKFGSCEKCVDGCMDFIDIRSEEDGYKYFLRCDKCGEQKEIKQKRKLCDNEIIIEIIHSHIHPDINYWLVASTEGYYVLKSSKATMPELETLPLRIRKEVMNRIKSFFSII